MKKALLVGGPSDIRRDLERKLRPLGIDIVDHLEYKKNSSMWREIPHGVEMVLGLIDMTAHKIMNSIREKAVRDQVLFVPIQRKWSFTQQRLQEFGLIP